MTESDTTAGGDEVAKEPPLVPFEAVELPDLDERLIALCDQLGVVPESVAWQELRQRLLDGADIRVIQRERGEA